MALTPPLPPAPYNLSKHFHFNNVPYGVLNLNDHYSAHVFYSKYQQPSPDTNIFAFLWYAYHLHLISTMTHILAEFMVLPPSAFQYTQCISNTLANDTTMTTPSTSLSLTFPISGARSVLSPKHPHPPSSPPVPETSDDGNNNLENSWPRYRSRWQLASPSYSRTSLHSGHRSLLSLTPTKDRLKKSKP